MQPLSFVLNLAPGTHLKLLTNWTPEVPLTGSEQWNSLAEGWYQQLHTGQTWLQFFSLYIAVPLLLGLIATWFMDIVMNALTRAGLAHPQMAMALGTLFTRSRQYAKQVGTTVHFIAGIGFAFFYCALLRTLPADAFKMIPLVAGFLGFVQGFVVSFLLVIGVAEFHPIPHFRHIGFHTALAYVLGHCIYGLTLGLGYLLFVKGRQALQFLFEPSPLWKFFGYFIGALLIVGIIAVSLSLAQQRRSKQRKI